MSNKLTSTNPAQWPSFNNWSVAYAEHANRNIKMLEVPVTLIQRVFRQRGKQRSAMRLYPIVIERRPYSVRACVNYLTTRKTGDEDPLLDSEVFAYEKLDGTNLGVRCDGAIFGRRQRVTGSSYAKVPLDGTVPDSTVIQNIKENIFNEVGITTTTTSSSDTLPKLLIYGELMINKDRYQYDERNLSEKWFAFGAVLHYDDVVDGRTGTTEEHFKALKDAGFLVTKGTDRITMRLNSKLYIIVENFGVPCTTLLGRGPLRKVCADLESKLMKNECEGVVLTSEDLLTKWKTGKEDESKGYDMLVAIRDTYSPALRRLAEIDEALLETLIKVSGNRPTDAQILKKMKTKTAKEKTIKQKKKQVYDDNELQKALDSAMTKYDAPEVYFERDDRDGIMSSLIKEITFDLAASNAEEQKCITTFVRKFIGKVVGEWKKSQRAN